jgi:hypothetical protein
MTKLLIGFVLGIAVATVGFSGVVNGVAKLMDRGVDTVKTQSQELAK